MNTFNKLKKWLGINDSLKLFEREQRGLYSTQPIEKNKIIIKIKSKYLLEYQKIYLELPIDGIEEANSLVAFYLTKLYFEKNEFWLNYIESLPMNLSEFPIFWSQNELNNLKYTSFYCLKDKNLIYHLDSIQQDFDIIKQYNNENNIIEDIEDEIIYDTYLRFRILVGSRIFGYVKYGNETSGIVPYIDLLNHSETPNTTWYFDDDLDSFVLASTKFIAKGEELCDNYGVKNNIELLLYYGFTIKSNPNPILSFNFDKTNYFFNLNFNIYELNEYDFEKKNMLKKKLEDIYQHHNKKIVTIKNENIINIFQDEIGIIKLLLTNF
jgi:hypothetical protein